MPSSSKDSLLRLIRDGKPMSRRQQLLLTIHLSVPAILAQLSSIVMQYIDASMVGRLGPDDSASIGLVSTSLWLFGGVCSALTAGFAVQVAHLIGAKRNADARQVVRQGLVTCLLMALMLAGLGAVLAAPLPAWLGGHAAICTNASIYFFILMASTPFLMIDYLASSMLRCSGNIKVPSLLNVLMCALDVVFNFLLIFPSHSLHVLGVAIRMPGAGLGVTGAALGTALAEATVAVMMLYYLWLRSNELRLTQDRGSFRPTAACLKKAVRISLPMALQHTVMCTAQVLLTTIVAPLGSVALAANSFAVTAESLCYMPGYGISEAATTLVGQSIGAGRRNLTRSFGTITVLLGMVVMTMMGVLMYVGAPVMMAIMSPVPQVIDLGAQCLRIEAWAEPLYAAAIVTYGVFVGAGDTLMPCVMNFVSMWAVRITLAVALVGSMGLPGVWTAMCVELCFRGVIFLIRLTSGKWMKSRPMQPAVA